MVTNFGQFVGQVRGRGCTKVEGVRNGSTTNHKGIREKYSEYRREGGLQHSVCEVGFEIMGKQEFKCKCSLTSSGNG